MRLTERQQKVLAAVVELYVSGGEPVGSKALCEALDFPVSSATVRNELSALAEQGLVEQPHTSAGRVPSHKGYRVYIDTLMKRRRLSQEEQHRMDSLLMTSAYEPEKLLDAVSRALAGMTRCAAVSTTPSGSGANVRAVQFVQTSRRTAMVLLMTSAGTMKTRVFHCDFDITPDILRVFFRVFNERLAGVPVEDVTPAFIQSMAAGLGEMGILMSSALMAVADVARDSLAANICMDGETNLLFYPELAQGGARRVMDFLERPAELTRFLLQQQGGARVLIGGEARHAELAQTSIIITRYAIGERDAGAIAIIGPTRIDYGRIIAHMEYLSHSVGMMLTELMDSD